MERTDLNKRCPCAPTRGSQRAGDGIHVAWLDHVRYERHADHPDEIVVPRRVCSRGDAVPSFSAVEAVRPRRTFLLRLDHSALESSPLAERRGSGHGHSVLWALLVPESGEAELGVRFQREPMTPLTPAERDALRLRAAKADEVFSGRTVGELILDARETHADASAGLLGAALDAILAQCLAEPFEPWPSSLVAELVAP